MRKYTMPIAKVNMAVAAVLAGHPVAVCFSSDLKTRVRATQTKYKRYTDPGHTITLTVSRLNYEEREFIKKCKRGKTKPKAIWFPKG